MAKKIKCICCLILSLSITFLTFSTSVVADETEDLEALFESLLSEETETQIEEEQQSLPQSAEEVLNNLDDTVFVENENISLTVDKVTGCLYVKEKSTDKLWTSNPYDSDEDSLATGITRTNLKAQLVIEYIKDDSISNTNSFAGSTNKGDTVFTVQKDSIRVDYTFSNEKIMVPIVYTLTKTGFKASVLFEEIKDTPNCRVYRVDVLPYFGAAGLNDVGYMLIPDGAGALVEFNNGKHESFPYEKSFYGGDQGKTKNIVTTIDKNLSLPVYGMKVGDSAFVATVEQGAEIASLYSCVSGKQNNYNRIYTRAVYRYYDTVNLSDAIGQNVYAKYTALDTVTLPSYTVSYSLLSGNKANYVGMAENVREWFTSNGLKKSDDGKAHLFVDFYGAIQKERAFLGIRYTGVQKLTTFSDAQKILGELKENGADKINVGYHNFSSSDYKGKLASKVVPDNKLGGKKDYKSLVTYAEDNNINIYPYADFVTFKENGNGYWSLTDVIMGLELSIIKRYDHNLNDGLANTGNTPWYLVAGDRYNKAKSQLLSTLKKYDSTGVMLDESVNYIYNDFSPKGYQTERTVSAMQEVYSALAEQGQKFLLSAPNAYAIKYASAITDLPMSSSQYIMFDGDVPFVQLVLKGQLPYSSEALNIEGLSDTTLLNLIETGSHPKFALIHEEGKYLIGTELDYLYGATYSECVDDILDYYNKISDVTKKIGDAAIISHIRNGELVTVTYENGVNIYLNYGKSAVKIQNDKTVEPLSFIIED